MSDTSPAPQLPGPTAPIGTPPAPAWPYEKIGNLLFLTRMCYDGWIQDDGSRGRDIWAATWADLGGRLRAAEQLYKPVEVQLQATADSRCAHAEALAAIEQVLRRIHCVSIGCIPAGVEVGEYIRQIPAPNAAGLLPRMRQQVSRATLSAGASAVAPEPSDANARLMWAVEMFGGQRGVAMLAILEDTCLSSSEKMEACYTLDNRVIAWEAAEWSERLGVTRQAVEKAHWFKNTRLNLLRAA